MEMGAGRGRGKVVVVNLSSSRSQVGEIVLGTRGTKEGGGGDKI